MIFSVFVGATAIGSLIYGSSLLLSKTYILVNVIKKHIDDIKNVMQNRE